MNRLNPIALSVAVLLAISANGGERTVETRNSAAPRFTLNEAILTALQQNPDILRARQDIERTKGLFIEMRAAALPQVHATSLWQDIDPHLGVISTVGGGVSATERSWNVDVVVRQVIFSGGRVPLQIRSADFQRDSSYYGFRNVIDQVIATVRTEFYQVLLNKALIGVQEESVNLLQSQLQDQQNRFEAGTVPRFNVLQAQVALSNQIPQLITARNTYRISQLQLAKTLGLDFDPHRGEGAPLEAVGELSYTPRAMLLTRAIELAKENRPFIKQQKAVVLSNQAQVGVARSDYFPHINADAGAEFRSSPFKVDIGEARSGYIIEATGDWAVWDMGATYGRVKQAKAVLEQSKITLDDDVRQVELEVQQAYANMQQGVELIQSQEKNVEQASEALRLAQARLDAGAGTQLEVLDARVQLTTARSTQLQALFTYNSAVADFDRVTATEVHYSLCLDEPNTRSKLRTERWPTPAPKPTPLPLNGDCGTTRTTKAKSSLAK